VTLFEYLTAANTLILSFAVLRLVACVPHALRPGRLYWVHASWLSVAIAFCLISFWGFWSYRELEWTLPLFIGALAPTVLIYVFTSLVAPSEPSTVPSWRDYFFGVRIPLLGTGVLFMGAVLSTNQALLGVSAFQLASLGPWALLAICAIGASSAKPRLHTVLAFWPPLLAVITLWMLARPDSLAAYTR
jgi:hypothetical protein